MNEIAKKTDEKLWGKVKSEVTKSDKGGRPGQWSARKAQLATSEYKAEGGGYEGEKTADNHLQQWTEEDWGTKSGRKSLETGERYLPHEARDKLTPAEYKRTSAKKRADMKHGKQHSAQPEDIAHKTADTHGHHEAHGHQPAHGKQAASGKQTSHGKSGAHGGQSGGEPSKASLYEEAKKRDIPGRSRMNREQLAQALRG